jgi:predicted NodU family carbamoyl transferase
LDWEDKQTIANAVRDAILLNKTDIVRSIMEEKLSRKTKNSFKIKKLSLTEEEDELSKGLVDVITEYVPEIPVHLNEKLYDLNTIINLSKESGIDPYTRFPFKLEHIVPAHKMQEKLDERIKKIEQNTKMKASTSVLTSKTGPQLYSQKENDVAAISQKENDIAARKRKLLH